MVEALIDFGEGEEIEEGVYEKAHERVVKLRSMIFEHLSDNRRGEIARTGIRLAIFGPPNVGKSSLLNFLAQRDAAIVTAQAGTTRDVLEVTLDLGGLPVRVADTAGLRETPDVVEQIGVERARDAIEAADVRLCVLSALDDVVDPDVVKHITPDTYLLVNKLDVIEDSIAQLNQRIKQMSDMIGITPKVTWAASVRTTDGMRSFIGGLEAVLRERYDLLENSEAPLITHTRHRTHLESALGFLDAFLTTPPEDVIFAAEELRYAAQSVGKVSGVIDVEDVLDAVFSSFCIGK